jgi:antitoxin (DNA-binding transcriptional repressor) of toxin-antitoxin stability system
MQMLNIHDAKTKLSKILVQVEKQSEKFVICRNGNPIADLIPHQKKSRLKTDPFLSQVEINCDLTKPMIESDWD